MTGSSSMRDRSTTGKVVVRLRSTYRLQDRVRIVGGYQTFAVDLRRRSGKRISDRRISEIVDAVLWENQLDVTIDDGCPVQGRLGGAASTKTLENALKRDLDFDLLGLHTSTLQALDAFIQLISIKLPNWLP